LDYCDKFVPDYDADRSDLSFVAVIHVLASNVSDCYI